MNCFSFAFKSKNGSSWLESSNLNSLPWITHAFTTRAAGDFRPAPPDQTPSATRRNDTESRFLKSVGTEQFEFASTHQVHSAESVQVTREGCALKYRVSGSAADVPASTSIPEADALITNERGVLLAIRTADCLPVLIADSRRGAVAAVHAGWRGALDGIIGKSVREMERAFGSSPQDLMVAVGPSIRACCYVVGKEVVDAFRSKFAHAEDFFSDKPELPADQPLTAPAQPARSACHESSLSYLDLVKVALSQFESAGVPGSHVQVAEFCTSCRTDLFFSYRKEGVKTGRMISVIGMRGSTGTTASD